MTAPVASQQSICTSQLGTATEASPLIEPEKVELAAKQALPARPPSVLWHSDVSVEQWQKVGKCPCLRELYARNCLCLIPCFSWCIR